MKKLVMLFAVLAMAIATQAAAIKWNTGTAANGFVDSNGNALTAASTGYTIALTLWDSTGNTILAQEGPTALTFGVTGGASGQMTYTAAASTTYYLQAVLTADNGATLTSEKASFTTPASGAKILNLTTGANFSSATAKWDPAGSWTGGDVPEPTSGLLLLIGGAMLALRRKQK